MGHDVQAGPEGIAALGSPLHRREHLGAAGTRRGDRPPSRPRPAQHGKHARPDSGGITVERARDSLIAGIAVIFTGLSIVLALTAVTAQNVASRFSLRLLRIQQRGWRDKVVIAVFTAATTFVITTQLGLRSLEPTTWLQGAVCPPPSRR